MAIAIIVMILFGVAAHKTPPKQTKQIEYNYENNNGKVYEQIHIKKDSIK